MRRKMRQDAIDYGRRCALNRAHNPIKMYRNFINLLNKSGRLDKLQIPKFLFKPSKNSGKNYPTFLQDQLTSLCRKSNGVTLMQYVRLICRGLKNLRALLCKRKRISFCPWWLSHPSEIISLPPASRIS
jgi:hypothetical protein